MSLVEDSVHTESEAVNVEDILANFFLKKIDMKGSRLESDDKYKKKSKHKKHKSKKHKRKSSRRSSSSERRNSNSMSIGCTSSSEEKDIKRLKKLKSLDVKDQSKLNSFLPVPLSSQNAPSSSEKLYQNNARASVEVNIPYGPSLELLLTGSEAIEGNAESKKQSILPLDQSTESSSHQANSVFSCSFSDPKPSSELASSKESETSNLIENTKVECKEENRLNDINKLLNTSNQFENVTDLKSSNIDSVVNQELTDRKEKRCKEKSQSRSRSRSKSPKRSRSKSCSSQSRSRKRSTSRSRKRSTSRSRKQSACKSRNRSKSRSRSKYRCHRRRSYSRDHSKSRHSSKSKSRRSRSGNRLSKSRRSRSRSLRRRRRSRSWSKDRARTKHDSKRRSRSNDRRYRSRSKERASHDRLNRKRKSSSDRELKSKQKSRSKSKEKYSFSKSCKIDQAKIREIAEKNVLHMIQQGTLPEGISLEHFKKKELVSIKAGGKSVQELTDFCAKLSKKENEVDDDIRSGNDASNLEGENDFIHHPFKLKEQSTIKLNIKNAVQIPVKTHAEKFAETAKLSSQFPVSSGNQHKQKELEWVPVAPKESGKDPKPSEVKSEAAVKSDAPKTVESSSSAIVPLPIVKDIPSIPLPSAASQPLPPPPPLPPLVPPLPAPPVPPFQLLNPPTGAIQRANNTAPQSVSYPALPACNSGRTDRPLFSNQAPSASTTQFDFASLFSKKFQAEQKLQGDPNNAEALKAIQEAEAALQEWVNSCRVPGMFYGSTHVKPLPREQLGGFKDYRVKRSLCFIKCAMLLVFSG